ncbi:MAG: hypothetical protein ABI239_05465 [Aquihabitans sp.]
MNRSEGSSVSWWRVRAVGVVGALVLVGCSGGGGDEMSSGSRGAATTVAGQPGSDTDDVDVDDAEQPVVVGEPVSHVPFDGEAPDGYRMITGDCEANAEAAAEAEAAGEYDYQSAIVFAVPEDWDGWGRGSGGSGGVTGTDVDLKYNTSASGEVAVEYEWDDRGPGGAIYDGSEPWESFDYESIDQDSVTTIIEYEQVGSIDIQDQTVDLFYRDPSQAPDLVDGEEYKARVSMFDIPNSLSADGMDQYSVVFTITFDENTAQVDQDVIEAIIGSVSMPTCVWDEMLLVEEVMRQADLNGDGDVKSMEDWGAQMQKDLEDAAKTADD